MTDPGSLAAIFTSIKTATDIAKLLRDTDLGLEKAELKNRISDLYVALSDLKMEAADIREAMAEKDARIAALEAALEMKVVLVRHFDAYYEVTAEGKPFGDAYCGRCWEADHRARHLVQAGGSGRQNWCPACKTFYEWDRTISLK